MERFKDRISNKPNRRKMTIYDNNNVSTTHFVDIERCSEEGVVQPGTPLNAETFNAILDKIDASVVGIEDTLTSTSKTKALSSNQGRLLNNTLGDKASLYSPAFTGIPTAPTADCGTNTTQIATTEFVQSAVSSISGGGGSGTKLYVHTLQLDINSYFYGNIQIDIVSRQDNITTYGPSGLNAYVAEHIYDGIYIKRYIVNGFIDYAGMIYTPRICVIDWANRYFTIQGFNDLYGITPPMTVSFDYIVVIPPDNVYIEPVCPFNFR